MAGYDPMFAELKAHLVPLLARITRPAQLATCRLCRTVLASCGRSIAFCERVNRAMGFDFDAGRMDTWRIHFCRALARRHAVTTRFDESDPFSALCRHARNRSRAL